MLVCREHGEPSRDQRSGSKNGDCVLCGKKAKTKKTKKKQEDDL